MLRRLIAFFRREPARPNLPPLPRPMRVPCANGWLLLPDDAVQRIRHKREDTERAIAIYEMIGYDPDGRPLPKGWRPTPKPGQREVIQRFPHRRH